jgi:hypothetical protein
MHSEYYRLSALCVDRVQTAEGIERIRRAITKHRWYSAAAKIEREQYRALLREGREVMRWIRKEFVG